LINERLDIEEAPKKGFFFVCMWADAEVVEASVCGADSSEFESRLPTQPRIYPKAKKMWVEVSG
jgi:hypothetical protein